MRACCHAVLNFDRRFHGGNRAAVFDQNAIAGGAHHPTSEAFRDRVPKLGPVDTMAANLRCVPSDMTRAYMQMFANTTNDTGCERAILAIED